MTIETDNKTCWTQLPTETMLLGLNFTMCDPTTQLKHTGLFSKVRHGTRGRFPTMGKFLTDCGKDLKVQPHKCDHSFELCKECESKHSPKEGK